MWNLLFGNAKKLREALAHIEQQADAITALEAANKVLLEELESSKKLILDIDPREHERFKELASDLQQLEKDIKKLHRDKQSVSDDLATTRHEHKLELENIAHMQKMLEEKAELEKDRAIFEAKEAASEEIRNIRKEYADKLEDGLKAKDGELSRFMNKVMEALPNVNAKLSGKI